MKETQNGNKSTANLFIFFRYININIIPAPKDTVLNIVVSVMTEIIFRSMLFLYKYLTQKAKYHVPRGHRTSFNYNFIILVAAALYVFSNDAEINKIFQSDVFVQCDLIEVELCCTNSK